MYLIDKLLITGITVEHMLRPLGIDCPAPRFGWKLHSDVDGIMQIAYRLVVSSKGRAVADSGRVASDQSIEVTVNGLKPEPIPFPHPCGFHRMKKRKPAL